MSQDDDGLLVDIGQAVVAIDDRLAGIESAVLGALVPEQRSATVARVRAGRRRGARRYSARSAAMLRAARARGDAGGITPTMWNLDDLTPTERMAALVQLRKFVDWLNRAYQLPISTFAVPSCWYQHSGVVRELYALLASYQLAYTTRIAQDASLPTDAPLIWHERALWPCLRRLREEHGLRECVATKRHTPGAQTPITTDDAFAGAVQTLAAEWNTRWTS